MIRFSEEFIYEDLDGNYRDRMVILVLYNSIVLGKISSYIDVNSNFDYWRPNKALAKLLNINEDECISKYLEDTKKLILTKLRNYNRD